MRESILEKLTIELAKGIQTEAQTVYLLVQMRKLIEHNSDKSYDTLKMFCDWALHTELSRNREIIRILKEFDEAMERMDKGYGAINYDFIAMKRFKQTMKEFLMNINCPKIFYQANNS